MIQKLTSKHQQQVLEFCYQRERENLFVIGSFKRYEDPFEVNDFFGYFQGDKLIGLAVYFRRFGNFVIHSQDEKVIEELVDYGVNQGIKVDCIAAFKKYAEVITNRLINEHHFIPKHTSNEIVYLLERNDFNDFSDGTEENATDEDIDEILGFNFDLREKEITDEERKRVTPSEEFILRKEGKIVSKANIHGTSDYYFQIGGVGTLPEYRKKGYAKQVVSSLCKTHFDQGLKYGLLFTDNDNIPAQKVYEAVGFKPVDDFMITEY